MMCGRQSTLSGMGDMLPESVDQCTTNGTARQAKMSPITSPPPQITPPLGHPTNLDLISLREELFRGSQHSPNTPTTGLPERGNDTGKSTGRSGRQNAATRRNMRREEPVTVQGPVKEQQPDGMSHRGVNRSCETIAMTLSASSAPWHGRSAECMQSSQMIRSWAPGITWMVHSCGIVLRLLLLCGAGMPQSLAPSSGDKTECGKGGK